jgi:phosphoribosylanthranilate isomerase
MRPLVKICGLTRVEDAELAVSLGASFVGAVRSRSPRQVSVERARALFAKVGSKAARVLVFRSYNLEDVVSDARASGADWVQLYHPSESDVRRVESGGFHVLQVYALSEEARELPSFEPEPARERPALLDVGGGGSGRTFDWGLLGSRAPGFTFVAGGIRPDNLDALLERRPYGIDLSSGVEREPGVKDEGKLRTLFDRIEGTRE